MQNKTGFYTLPKQWRFFYGICLYIGLGLIAPIMGFAQPTQNVSGILERTPNFASQYVAPRHIDVWLPPDYYTNTRQQYAVLYMHDGQNLFSTETAYGGQEWQADETMLRLQQEQKVRPCIIVGIWNSPRRFAEYLPNKPFLLMPKPAQEKLKQERTTENTVLSDAYLAFLVKELKPYIDQKYRTLPDRANTFIAGSSMGGLISLYALCEYPKVFGGAACFSTHWPASLKENNPNFVNAYLKYLKKKLPKPKHHKIYFDYGTQTLDAWYEPHQKAVDAFMQQSGYFPQFCLSQKFEGAAHNEQAWQQRFHVPLLFLLPFLGTQ
ncbi:MAG TPA: alpha/beta hydrolase-fold protein [Chitinophagales bacterium]|nr:alpha/beta hydrolase-fold protein [Chitinophagales bacterium]HRK26793.1 alpha/beta hydrolase-fold protein [Chitinophagales bacterium]